ncbi:MAG: tetratricopeptide repeat protein [Lysobacter sp.]|nr:tetratricopeptide repeat protein [Lysobacter sp.]
MTVFYLVSAMLALLLLMFLLLPLWRRKTGAAHPGQDPRRKALQDAFDAGVLTREEFDAKLAALPEDAPADTAANPQTTRTVKIVMVSIAILLPLGVFGLYRAVGTPDALSQAGSAASTAAMPAAAAGGAKTSMDMDAAIGSLRAKLEKNPGDADGWLLLGRAYQSVGRNDEGGKAFQKAYELAPDRPAIEIAYAESLALTSTTRRIEGKPLQMIHHAMKADPENQDGLWLIGMSDYQNGRYAEAIVSWEKIRKQLGPDSDVLESVNNMIGDAKAHLRGEPTAGTAMAGALGGTAAAAATAGGGPRLQVRVALAKKREGQASPGDTVFVFAKAAGGPPTPLAIRRLQASDLPTTIELTDADAMVPEMRLSKFKRITVTARISKSGDASPKPGDLQSAAIEADTGQSGPIEISIDQVVP